MRMGERGHALALGCFLAVVLAGLEAFALAQSAQGRDAKTVEALLVSDIHFDPFSDPTKAVKLAAAPVAEWNAILAAPASADAHARWVKIEDACSAHGDDTTFALYRSSLRAIQADARGAKFVLLSGDLIAHDFSCKYAAVFPKAAPDAYRAFVEKTMDYVLTGLRAALPGVPVYAALGNNDSDCGDYRLNANSPFLRESAALFAADLRGREQTQARASFAADGSYRVALPAPFVNTRLLVLNNLFESSNYQSCGGKADRAPAAAQIGWLKAQLNEARAKKEKLWVMAHIPPGVNSYATARKWRALCAGGEPQMFLASETLPEVLAGYGDVIRLVIFAHTHMDELRLLAPASSGAAQKNVAVKMVASISPIHGNNPSFTLATIDPKSSVLDDYRVIVASNRTGVDAAWSEEYDFRKTFGKPAFTAEAVRDLIAGFKADPAEQSTASQNYLRYTMPGVDMRGMTLLWQPYVCSLTNSSTAVYRQCVCRNAP